MFSPSPESENQVSRGSGKWIGLTIILVIALAIILIVVYQNYSSLQPIPNQPAKSSAAADASRSLKVYGRAPEFKLIDQNGVEFTSDQLQGKPWIANFMFTGCVATCPKQTAELKAIQDQLRKDGQSDKIHLISFSVDPGNDTPAVLKRYASNNGVDDQVWKFLTGEKDELRNAISRDGFKLAVEIDEDDPNTLMHSPSFVLVDAYMRMRGIYDSGKPEEVSQMVDDLQKLEEEILLLHPKTDWLESRQQAQLTTAESISVYHDFGFSDQRISTGIDFMHKIVDDAGSNYKPVHYDHGTGIVVADIDGNDLLDIYFVNQVGPNGLWLNLGQGKFKDITQAAGLEISDRICVSASFGDIDNDGDPDLFVTAVRKGNLLFENLGDGNFKNITDDSGLGYKGHSSGAVFFDFDRDGLLDLFVNNVGRYTHSTKTSKVTMESIRGEDDADYYYPNGFEDGFAGHLKKSRTETSRLYRNLDGKQFADVSEDMNLVDGSWTGDATPIDINVDGWPDLYLVNMQGDDQCYLNLEGKSFENVGRKYFPKTPWGSMGVKAFDFENDGDLDLYITDMHSDMAAEIPEGKEKLKCEEQLPASFLGTFNTSIFGNAFYRNESNQKFTEISDQVGAENLWPWGISVGDLNADGFDDVFISASMNFPYPYSVNSLLLNENGVMFRDSEFILGVEPRAGGITAPWFELDTSNTTDNALILETIQKFSPPPKLPKLAVVWSALGTRSSVLFDLENDGDLDIVTLEMNHYPMVLVSDLSEKKQDMTFIKVKLVGTKSNRSAFGAVVNVDVDGKKLMKVKDGQSGYMSHSDFPLYFGLDSAKQVNQIKVDWPSGQQQIVEGPLDVNRLIVITEEE